MRLFVLVLFLKVASTNQQEDKIYSSFDVDIKAQPKEGWSNFFKEFSLKTKLKEFEERETLKSDTGCFKVHFVIEKDGKLTYRKYSQCLSIGLQNEIKIGLEKCNKWTSAIKNGKKVRQEELLQLDFFD